MKLNKIVSALLRKVNKNQGDLAQEMGLKRQSTISDKLSKGNLDKPMMIALSKVTGLSEFEINNFIDEASETENSDITYYLEEIAKLKKEVETIKILDQTIDLQNQKISHYLEMLTSKDKIIEEKQKIIDSQENIITRADINLKNLQLALEKLKKSKA